MKNKINIKNIKVYILGGFCGILAILSIFMTIETATSGAEIANLQKEEIKLINQQQEIKENLVEKLSTNFLQEKSTEMGFTKVGNLVYVSGGVPVARLP
jgi:hypothetical protein